MIPDFGIVKDFLTEFVHITASIMEANQTTIASLQRHKVAEPNRWCLEPLEMGRQEVQGLEEEIIQMSLGGQDLLTSITKNRKPVLVLTD